MRSEPRSFQEVCLGTCVFARNAGGRSPLDGVCCLHRVLRCRPILLAWLFFSAPDALLLFIRFGRFGPSYLEFALYKFIQKN